MPQSLDRREALRQIGAIAAWLAALRASTSIAAELPHLTSSNPSAASLGYTEDSGSVDERKFPKHQATQRCANCKSFQGAAGAAFGPCALYPGNAVNANGWCSGYTAK